MSAIGPRLRKARKARKITQSELARRAGISVSYLNLIEHSRRNVGEALLARLCGLLDLDPQSLHTAQDARLVHDLEAVAADPLLRDIRLEPEGASAIVGAWPGWAGALLRLHEKLRAANESLEAMSERLGRDPYMSEASHEITNLIAAIRSLSEILADMPDLPPKTREKMIAGMASESRRLGKAAKALFDFISDPGKAPRSSTPAEQVNDFLIDHQNHFPALEDAADDLRARLLRIAPRLNDALLDYLARHHGMETVFAPPSAGSEPGSAALWHLDRKAGQITLANTLPEASVRFQLVQVLFELEHARLIRDLSRQAGQESDTQDGARRALSRYGAGALLFPYADFLAACRATRYDIQALRQRFGGSFEQICHRMTTLKRKGSEGVPFAFLRVDPAGNISKRLSLPDLPLPRGGGACPLLPAYRAFLTPGRIRVRIGERPDGGRSLYVARTVAKHVGAYGEANRMYAVMIACDVHYMDEVIYGDRLSAAMAHHLRPIGVHCRTCARTDCQHRAHASILLEQEPAARQARQDSPSQEIP